MSINFKQIEDKLKTEARKMLEEGKVSLVLAYRKGYDENHPLPYVAKCAADVENIVFNEYCTANMARYLVRYPRGAKIAIAVKAADSRAVIQLTPPEILCSLGSAIQYRLWFVLKRESFGLRGGSHV